MSLAASRPGTVFARALHEPDGYTLTVAGGGRHAIPFDRWLGPATGADERVLHRARGPVLDVGCGPGRHVHALARRGVLALGVDVSASAVRLARERGARAHEASIFRAIPGEGTWACALLLDGNLGIGGHPARLLRRIRELLAPPGFVLVETESRGVATRRVRAWLDGPAGTSAPFAWAFVGADGLGDVARAAGLHVADAWTDDGRWFAQLH
ncbi:MAG: methyltransferase domain-containing protein [Solirubrobacterales bacterium]